jgi:hypothetical protein
MPRCAAHRGGAMSIASLPSISSLSSIPSQRRFESQPILPLNTPSVGRLAMTRIVGRSIEKLITLFRQKIMNSSHAISEDSAKQGAAPHA